MALFSKLNSLCIGIIHLIDVFLIMKMTIFRGELTDISAATKSPDQEQSEPHAGKAWGT